MTSDGPFLLQTPVCAEVGLHAETGRLSALHSAAAVNGAAPVQHTRACTHRLSRRNALYKQISSPPLGFVLLPPALKRNLPQRQMKSSGSRRGEKERKKAELERDLVESRARGKQRTGASISRARAPDNVIRRWRELARALKTDEESLSSGGKRRAKPRKGETSAAFGDTASPQPPGRRALLRLTRWLIISSPPQREH